MKTIIDKNTGKELYGTILPFTDTETEVAVDEVRTVFYENPYFDFETREYYNL